MSADIRTSASAFSRRHVLSALAASPFLSSSLRSAVARSASFQAFVASLLPQAEKAGVSKAIFERATAGLVPDAAVPRRAASQPEFETPIWVYLSHAAGPLRIARGKREAQLWRPQLAAIARRSGVPPEIALAVWGMEADFTEPAQTHDVVRSLATLAWTRPDEKLFRTELFAAMKMMQEGLANRARLRGSWAGAMGMPQFMPSAYLRYAVSFQGGHAANIWTSVPDALASIANFLAKSGWKRSLRWGFEVLLPERFEWRSLHRSFPEWRQLGVRRADGKALPGQGAGALFAPAGAEGPCFLISDNFWVIKAYNTSDSYALALGLLSDAIAGRPGLRRRWPPHAPMLSLTERIRLQEGLSSLGLYHGPRDGKIGPATREAVHRFEWAVGLAPADGLPSPRVLAALDQRLGAAR